MNFGNLGAIAVVDSMAGVERASQGASPMRQDA
jgi:hypothetical protein